MGSKLLTTLGSFASEDLDPRGGSLGGIGAGVVLDDLAVVVEGQGALAALLEVLAELDLTGGLGLGVVLRLGGLVDRGGGLALRGGLPRSTASARPWARRSGRRRSRRPSP